MATKINVTSRPKKNRVQINTKARAVPGGGAGVSLTTGARGEVRVWVIK